MGDLCDPTCIALLSQPSRTRSVHGYTLTWNIDLSQDDPVLTIKFSDYECLIILRVFDVCTNAKALMRKIRPTGNNAVAADRGSPQLDIWISGEKHISLYFSMDLLVISISQTI